MLSDQAEARLTDNGTFYRALIEVVIEPSEVGLVAFDDGGRHVIVDPQQIRDYDLGDWTDAEIAEIRERAAARVAALFGQERGKAGTE